MGWLDWRRPRPETVTPTARSPIASTPPAEEPRWAGSIAQNGHATLQVWLDESKVLPGQQGFYCVHCREGELTPERGGVFEVKAPSGSKARLWIKDGQQMITFTGVVGTVSGANLPSSCPKCRRPFFADAPAEDVMGP